MASREKSRGSIVRAFAALFEPRQSKPKVKGALMMVDEDTFGVPGIDHAELAKRCLPYPF